MNILVDWQTELTFNTSTKKVFASAEKTCLGFLGKWLNGKSEMREELPLRLNEMHRSDY